MPIPASVNLRSGLLGSTERKKRAQTRSQTAARGEKKSARSRVGRTRSATAIESIRSGGGGPRAAPFRRLIATATARVLERRISRIAQAQKIEDAGDPGRRRKSAQGPDSGL